MQHVPRVVVMIIGHQESFPEERAAVRSPPDTTDYDCRVMTTEGPTVSHH